MRFAREGFQVNTAVHVAEALELAGRSAPDVLIVDWMLMDTLDGIEVAEQIQLVNPELKTVLISGFPSAELEERVARANGIVFLSKPFEYWEIVAVVREILGDEG
jgi:DNA-binding NtrC family response regulator